MLERLEGGKVSVRNPSEYRKMQGIREGDEVVKVNGQAVAGVELWKVKEQMGALKDTSVTILREGKEITFTIHGAQFPPAVSGRGAAKK